MLIHLKDIKRTTSEHVTAYYILVHTARFWNYMRTPHIGGW